MRSFKAVVLGLCVILGLAGFKSTAVSDPDATRNAQSYLNKLVSEDWFSGSVLLARGGKILLSQGYGMANLEYDRPNTPKTKFRIGSLTKQITAAAVLLLQERGKLSVRDSVCKYVVECPAVWQPITIHHLLSNTSGIFNFQLFPDNFAFERQPTTVLEVIGRFKDKDVEFPPGQKYDYSSSNFALLGHIIEQVSGQSYEDFLDTNIYRRLGMHDSGYDHPSTILKNRATGYRKDNATVQNVSYWWQMDTPFAAGSQYSTVEDLYRWSQAMNNEELLSRASLDAMFTAHAPEGYNGYAPISYAYGWMLTRFFDRRTFYHNGIIGGFRSLLAILPDDHVTVIILSNREDAMVLRMALDLSATVLGEQYSVPTRPVKVSPAILDAYVGQYQSENNEIIVVSRRGDDLVFDSGGRGKLKLTPQSDTEFLTPGGLSVAFVRSSSGSVSHLLTHDRRQARKIE